jgi:hypothetical protein
MPERWKSHFEGIPSRAHKRTMCSVNAAPNHVLNNERLLLKDQLRTFRVHVLPLGPAWLRCVDYLLEVRCSLLAAALRMRY